MSNTRAELLEQMNQSERVRYDGLVTSRDETDLRLQSARIGVSAASDNLDFIKLQQPDALDRMNSRQDWNQRCRKAAERLSQAKELVGTLEAALPGIDEGLRQIRERTYSRLKVERNTNAETERLADAIVMALVKQGVIPATQ